MYKVWSICHEEVLIVSKKEKSFLLFLNDGSNFLKNVQAVS